MLLHFEAMTDRRFLQFGLRPTDSLDRRLDGGGIFPVSLDGRGQIAIGRPDFGHCLGLRLGETAFRRLQEAVLLGGQMEMPMKPTVSLIIAALHWVTSHPPRCTERTENRDESDGPKKERQAARAVRAHRRVIRAAGNPGAFCEKTSRCSAWLANWRSAAERIVATAPNPRPIPIAIRNAEAAKSGRRKRRMNRPSQSDDSGRARCLICRQTFASRDVGGMGSGWRARARKISLSRASGSRGAFMVVRLITFG